MEEETPQDPADSTSAPDPPENELPSGDNLIVVGVGASAGGLEAFLDLIRYLPSNTGMAFILVQHLDPSRPSALSELVAAKTDMPVMEVRGDTPIHGDHIYVMPPNARMLVRNRMLVLEERPITPDKLRPIDAFFHSLAEEYRFNAVGVVLSGAASDGTLGLKSIKAEGGITFAQNQTAKFETMPRSAVAAGVVDFIFPPRRIAEELVALSHRVMRLDQSEGAISGDGSTLHRVLLLLRNATSVDFTQYKQPTILRRLGRRIVVRKAADLDGYYEILQKEPTEAKALFDDLLIHVTDFFRDPAVFDTAKRTAFPAIVAERKQPCTIRAWVPGCSSGEEVYSIAIALVEFLETENLDCAIQMFGTDVSDSAIDQARAATYDESAVRNVSPARLRRFFVRTEQGYQINRTIRDLCIFSRHNVAKDPPLSRMSLISCRNLLIYFSPSLQRRIIGSFGYALQQGGCLILGPSESLGGLSDYFKTLDEPHKIYSRSGNVPQSVYSYNEPAGDYSAWRSAASPSPPRYEAPSSGEQMHRFVNQIVLSRYGPAGVVVNESLRIVEYRGDVGVYLSGTPQPAADLMDVVRTELRATISTAIEQARRTNVPVLAENIPGEGAHEARVSITVVPLSLAESEQHFLILFGGAHEEIPGETSASAPAAFNGAARTPPEQENLQLKQELKATREYLQSVIEELRSANEEAQSANEELQSTNEEMQTSKEELQSSNEELNAINSEMQTRNGELAQVNDDLINLLGSMNMPIVMTGSDLRIRRFTPVAERVLHLIPADVGRPIADLKPRININDLEEILQRVLDTLEPHEQEVEDREGRVYIMRVRPYRTADNRIDGAVLQLLDVSELKRSLEEAKQASDYAKAIVNTVREPLVVLDRNLVIQDANPAFFESLGLGAAGAPGTIPGATIYDVARRQFDIPPVRALFERLDGGAPHLSDIEVEILTDGEARTLVLNARRLQTDGQKPLILMAFEDITDRKQAAEARYRRLFESARDGILLADAVTGEVLDLNPYTERLLGYARHELVGRKLWQIEPMRGVPEVESAMERIRDQGAMRFDDLTLRTKNGHEILTEVVANVYTEGARRAVQFNIRDVGERKKFERELQESQKLEGLGLLAGGIAHDFNNLLTGILGNASLAYSEVAVDQPVRAHLRQIVQASERAAFLTRQMLAYAGKGRFVIEPIDLAEMVREIAGLVRMSIPANVELNLDLAPGLPQIDADSSQIQQVVMNLVINGAEAIGENKVGKVVIRVSLREFDARETIEFFGARMSGDGAYVQLEISDNGSGMDEATKARIFDPFFTTKFTGRGLGLAAVQGIVKSHGGAIRVYSTPGRGTSFFVFFPARRRKAAAVPPPASGALSIPEGTVALVIDDEEMVRKVAQGVLSQAGVRVLTAENGKEGVETLLKNRDKVSVILLDLQMPVMGGEEALAKLKEIRADVPVILSSGYNEREAGRRFSGLKPARFLQKPYTADRLIAAIAATLNAGKQ